MKNFEININAHKGYKELFYKTGNPIFLIISARCKEMLKTQEDNKEDDFSLTF